MCLPTPPTYLDLTTFPALSPPCCLAICVGGVPRTTVTFPCQKHSRGVNGGLLDLKRERDR